MVLPVGLIVSLVTGVMNGPVSKVLDAVIKDQELRRKLQSELEAKLTEHLGKTQELEQAIVLAEIKSEHWLTRSWRPILMLTLLGFIVRLFDGRSCLLQPPLASTAATILGLFVDRRWWLHRWPDFGEGCRTGFALTRQAIIIH
jgi:Holin of 3TMs, for gene-transfer release